MQERVEVHNNPRVSGVDLTGAQLARAFAPPRKKRKASGAAAKNKPKKKKGGKRKASAKKVPILQLLVGAAITAAVEIYVFRNSEYEDKIPLQARRFSGAIMAVAGILATMMKGKMGNQIRPVAYGIAAAGAFLQLSDELAKTRKESLVSEANKWGGIQLKGSEDDEETGTDGLGRLYGHRYPRAPNMNAAQAAAALGMQSRVPYHPYGLGTFDYSSTPGQLGVLVDMAAPMDPTNDPFLDPGGLSGLGILTDSGHSGAWLEGQFAFSDSDYRDSGW